MNKNYRLIRSANQQMWVVAPETAKGRGKNEGAGRASVVATATITLMFGVLAQTACAQSTSTGLLIGQGGAGGTTTGSSIYGPGGSGGIGGGGGGSGLGTDYPNGRGLIPTRSGADGGGPAGGTGLGGAGGDSSTGGASLGGAGGTQSGANAGSTITATLAPSGMGASAANAYAISGAISYSYVGVGGGGGGGSASLGGSGTDGYLDIEGSGNSLSVSNDMLIGGAGGGGAGGSGGLGGKKGGGGGSGTVTVTSAALSVAGVLQVGGGGGGGSGSAGGSGGTGALTVTSGSTLSAGVMQIGGGGGGGGAGSVTILGNSTVSVGQLTVGGDSGTGSLGTGGSGGAGILNFGGGSALDFSVPAPGFIINSNGTFNVGNASVNSTTGGQVMGLTALTNNGAINFNQTNTFTLAAAISGHGTLTQAGSGTTILNGNSSTFAGMTNVTGGTLEIGDAADPGAALGGSVSVATGGTLRGHGTIDGNVINSGTVAPGGTIGILSVNGNYYTPSSRSTLAIEVSPTAASLLKVSGSASLAGTLAVTYDPGTYSPKTYTVVSAGSLGGLFSGMTGAGVSYLGSLTPSIQYAGNNVNLVLAASTTATDSGSTSTPVSVPSTIVVAPQNVSIFSAMGTTAVLGAQAQGAALLGGLEHSHCVVTGEACGWVNATGSQTKVGSTNNEPGFQVDRYGFLAGLDQRIGDYTVGAAVGFEHADVDEQITGDSGAIDTLRASLYGAHSLGPMNLAATFGVGLDFLSQKRPFGSIGTAQGDHVGQEFNLGTQVSMPMTFGSVTVTPRAGLRYAYFHANGFGEDGAGGQDLSVHTDNVHSLQPYVGINFDKAFGDAMWPIDAELRFGYAYELLDVNRVVTVESQDGTQFAAQGTNMPRGYLTAGAGVTFHPKKYLDVMLSYDTVFNTAHASAQQGTLRIDYRF